MFEDSLVASGALLRTRNRWPALLSVTAQCAIAVVVASLPLLHPELIPLPGRIPVALAPPHLPTRTTTPVVVSRAVAHAWEAAAPVAAAAAVTRTAEWECSGLKLTGPGVDATTLGAINLAGAGSGPQGLGGPAPAGPHVAVAAAKARGPVKVSSGVLAGFLLAPIRPSYPEIAKVARVAGDVVIEAVISRSGAIESARVVRGPAMLQAAALDAVRAARYRPFLLNGQPTEVQTTITIAFRIGG